MSTEGNFEAIAKPRLQHASLLVVAAVSLFACGDDPDRGSISGPDPEEITLIIRVHLLSSGFRPLNATITENELQVLFERVNETWEPAHITWDIDSIIREEALNSGDFKRLLQGELPASGQIVASVIPRGNLFSGKWDVFLILDLAGIAGGFFFPSIPAVLSAEVDPLGNRDLTGSAARILAHELGHSLSLQHVPCTPEGNLMAPACEAQDRTRLTATQIKAARRQAETGSPFTLGGAIGSSE